MARGDRFRAPDQAAPAMMPGRGRAHMLVGNALYHTVGDRAQAAMKLAIDWDATYREIGALTFPGRALAQIGNGSGARTAEMKDPHANAQWVAFWFDTFVPAATAWSAFKAKVLGGDLSTGSKAADSYLAYADRWGSDWSEYTQWEQKLVAMRNAARLMGMKLVTPDPDGLATTIWEDAGHAGQKIAEHVGDLSKIAVWGAIGVCALGVGIYAARGGK